MSSEPDLSSTPPLGSPPARADSDSDILSSLVHPPGLLIPTSQHLSLEDLRHAVQKKYTEKHQVGAQTQPQKQLLPRSSAAQLMACAQKEDQDIDLRSPNSSITLETTTPSSTPELAKTNVVALDSSSELELSSVPRELPWVEKRILSNTSPRALASNDTQEARIQALDGLSTIPRRDSGNLHSTTVHEVPHLARKLSEELLPATPPLTPVIDDESEDEEIASLRTAIAASLTALRNNTFDTLKGILKDVPVPTYTPLGRSNSSFSSRSNSGLPKRSSSKNHVISHPNSLSTDQSSLDTIPMEIGSNSLPIPTSSMACPAPMTSKKMVRWDLSEEQELKEQQRPQVPHSPGKVHRGNRLIFTDHSPDELMDVCSDDGPTPPLSPNTSYDECFSLHDSKKEVVASTSFPVPLRSTLLNSPVQPSPTPYPNLFASSTLKMTSNTLTSVSASSIVRTPPSSSPKRKLAPVTQETRREMVVEGAEGGKEQTTNSKTISPSKTQPRGIKPTQSNTTALVSPHSEMEASTPAPLMRSSLGVSGPTFGLPGPTIASLQRSKSQNFGGGSSNVRSNTRSNQLIGTLADPHESSINIKNSNLKRSSSEFEGVAGTKNVKKRQREDEATEDNKEAQIPSRKKWLPPS